MDKTFISASTSSPSSSVLVSNKSSSSLQTNTNSSSGSGSGSGSNSGSGIRSDTRLMGAVSQCVLSACLTNTTINTSTNIEKYSGNSSGSRSKYGARTPLPLLLRLQTVHTQNVPEKGSTVWYLQIKSVCIGLPNGSNKSEEIIGEESVSELNVTDNNGKARTLPTRTVNLLEALEGTLVGIHKQGEEEPFYTVSLAAPIHGSAGNTVREVQTNGYRYRICIADRFLSLHTKNICPSYQFHDWFFVLSSVFKQILLHSV